MNPLRHLPNALTSMNLLCGVAGVVCTLQGRFCLAFPLMLCAAAFDFLDGLCARLLNAYSNIGKELDSLADMVSFGVLPSLMLYQTMSEATDGSRWSLLTLILAVFSALRLAKFNTDARQTEQFIGLPVPASAMICGAWTALVHARPESFAAAWTGLAGGYVCLPVLAVTLGLLAVSEIPMFSMKFGRHGGTDRLTLWKRTAFLTITALIALTVPLLGGHWTIIVLLVFSAYLLMNLIFLLFPERKMERGATE